MTGCKHILERERDEAAILAAVELAGERCIAAGERWNPARRRVYELLVREGGPLKAYDMLTTFSPETGLAKPPTIYRALDFLVAKGLAHRLESLNAFIACSRPHDAGQIEFLICECCGRTQELALDVPTSILTAAKKRGFTIKKLIVEGRGRCADCK